MKLNKRNENLIIISLYLLTIFVSAESFFGIAIIDTIRKILLYLIPLAISASILFDNRKNIKKLFQNKIFAGLYLLLVIWLILSVIFGIKIHFYSVKGLYHFGVLVTLIFVLYNVEFKKEQLKRVKKHILISFMITAFLGIIQYLFQINLNTYNNDKYPGILGRIHSTFYIATLYDKYATFLFPIITYELLKDKDNLFYRSLLFISMAAVTLTFARSGILVYLVMCFIFFLITLFKKQTKNAICVVCVIVLMLMIPGAKYPVQSSLNYAYDTFKLPKYMLLNVLDILGSDLPKDVDVDDCVDADCVNDVEGSKFFRDYYNNVGKELIKNYPIFGIGVGNETYLFEHQNVKEYIKNPGLISDEYEYMYPHSAYIYLAAEIGIVGLVLFILFLICPTVYSLTDKKFNARYAVLLLLFALFIGCTKEGIFHSRQIAYVFAIIYGVYCNKNNKIR